jgi:carbohydrate-selective porin OprB
MQNAVNDGTIDQSSYPDRCSGSTVDCYPWFNGTSPLQFGKKITNSYGVEFAWNVADWMSFSAFGSYTAVKLIGHGTGDIWTYGAGLAFPDLGKEGNLLGLFVGVQPYLSSGNTLRGAISYNNTAPLHIEAFYKFQITDNISLTPGVIYINNPVQTQFSNNSWIGTLRGTFTF